MYQKSFDVKSGYISEDNKANRPKVVPPGLVYGNMKFRGIWCRSFKAWKSLGIFVSCQGHVILRLIIS